MTLFLEFYKKITWAFHFIAVLHLKRRLWKNKEDPLRFREKLGQYIHSRPRDGVLLWIHGASVGESLSALLLIDCLLAQKNDLRIMVTTGTVSSAALMVGRLPKRAFHQYVPLDTPQSVSAFYKYWKPSVGMILESELWPNLILSAQDNQIPLFLVNGRISEKSFKGWQKRLETAGLLLNSFQTILAQNQVNKERFSQLGAENVSVIKSMKFCSNPLPVSDIELYKWKKALGERPIWIASSTHEGGEEEIILKAHEQLLKQYPDLLLVIVPRHCDRGEIVENLSTKMKLKTLRRHFFPMVQPETQVYVADTMGELGLWYRLSRIAFIGKSLLETNTGGHNPLEAIRLRCIPIHGAFVQNFPEIYEELEQVNGSILVQNQEQIQETVDKLLQSDAEYEHYCTNAKTVLDEAHQTLETVAHHILPFLYPDI